MFTEAALSLSIPELLRVLNERLGLECTRAQDIRLPPILGSITSLKAEIESLETRAYDVLRLISSMRNMLQPVNRLPPETLSRIAQCFLDENAADTSSIIPLTHVCRYWRESIVSTPRNWRFIWSGRMDLAALSLERSKAAPLALRLDMQWVHLKPGFLDLITPYIHNTETVRVVFYSTIEKLAQNLPNFLQSMPNLRSLSLSRFGFPSQRPDRPINLFGPLTPTLTHLSLTDVPLQPSFLHLRTLTDLTLIFEQFNLYLDTLLDFLEENRSLERTTLQIHFAAAALRKSWRSRVAIGDQLRSLSIRSFNAMDGIALISNIALQRGAHLEITLDGRDVESKDVLSVLCAARLSNLQSPTFMEYHPDKMSIQLLGPNGSFSFKRLTRRERPFTEFPLLHLTNVRAFSLARGASRSAGGPIEPIAFPPLSLPALETFSIEREPNLSHLLSSLLSNPSSSPSLRTLAFLDCQLEEEFMEELTLFAFNRKNTTSAWLYRIVIVNSKGNLPIVSSIEALREHVPVVDARIGQKLPTDLV